ncbi:hypothetical protein GCM10027051_35400 [Niabella terrae]
MEKDLTIISLIDRLRQIIDFGMLEIIDYWEGDQCAIGLKRYNRLVYISTFNFIDTNSLNYDFDLEVIDINRNESQNIVGKGRAVSEAELISAVKYFLQV